MIYRILCQLRVRQNTVRKDAVGAITSSSGYFAASIQAIRSFAHTIASSTVGSTGRFSFAVKYRLSHLS